MMSFSLNPSMNLLFFYLYSLSVHPLCVYQAIYLCFIYPSIFLQLYFIYLWTCLSFYPSNYTLKVSISYLSLLDYLSINFLKIFIPFLDFSHIFNYISVIYHSLVCWSSYAFSTFTCQYLSCYHFILFIVNLVDKNLI